MMIVVMKQDAAVSEISSVIRKIEALGLRARPSHGTKQTTIGMIGGIQDTEKTDIERMPGVSQVTPITKSFKLVNREFKPEPTVVKVNGVSIGAPAPWARTTVVAASLFPSMRKSPVFAMASA